MVILQSIGSFNMNFESFMELKYVFDIQAGSMICTIQWKYEIGMSNLQKS